MKGLTTSKELESAPVTQTGRILAILKQRGRISNEEMWNMRIKRGAARISDLKDEGHMIVSVRDTDTRWLYIYKGHRDDLPA